MSGLALFFHKTAAAETSSNNDSLLLRLDDAAAGITTTDTKRSSSVVYDTSLVDTIHTNDLDPTAEEESNNNKDTVPWKKYSEWKEWQKSVVRDFLWERLFENEEEQNDGNEDMENNDDDNDDDGQQSKVEQTAAVGGHEEEEDADDEDEEEEKEESAMFETQQETVMIAHHHHYHHHAQDEDTLHHQDENSSIIKQRGTGRISPFGKKISRRPIPCISETFGSVHYVADLDLHSNIVDLARLSLDRTWPLRSTKREAIKNQSWHFDPLQNRPLGRFLSLLEEQQHQQYEHSSSSLTVLKHQQSLLARMSSCSLWHPGEDDGPLAIMYHDVLNMEVNQLLHDDCADSGGTDTTTCGSPSLRRRAEAPFLTTTTITNRRSRDDGDDVEDCRDPIVVVVPRRRLKIFLYGTYATDIQNILTIISASSPLGAAKVVFRLRNVPSWCIFPYNDHHHHYNGSLPRSTDWYDSHGDMAPYCVCIGDDSMMKYTKEAAPSCLTLPPNDTTTASTKKDAKAMRFMRFDHSNLCMHVGLVVTKREGSSSLNDQRSADPKPRRTNISSQHHDGAAWLVLREWHVTARGFREVTPGSADEDAADTSNDDDLEHDVNQQQASGRSVFGEWYSDYQEREQRQQQQRLRQQQPQAASTNGSGDNSTVAPTVTTNTNNTATDTATTHPETTAENASGARQETQGQERQTMAAATSLLDNDLSRKSTSTNAEGQGVIVGGSRSLMQSEQNEQVTAAAAAAVNQQTTRSTTGPSNGPATAAREEERGSRRTAESGSVNQGSGSNQGGHGPPINGQHRSEGMPSPRKRQRTMQHYSPLEALRRALDDKKVKSTLVQADVYGVVLGFGSPSLTKRGDWMMAVSLVDESLPLPGETGEVRTVNLNIFSKQRDEMPQIQFAGDVLRAHRVKVQEWNEELQLMGLRASSYVVFRADSNNRQQTDNLTVLPTAKHEFAWTEEDKDRFIKLWQWGQRRLFSHPTMKESQSFKLSQMLWHTDNRVEKYQDSVARGDVTLLVCAILEMSPEKRSSATPRGFLRVWDGTGPPESDPFPDDCIANGYNANRDGDPPSCVVEKLAGIMQELRRIRQNPNLQEPKALTGRLGNVAIWEEPFWELVQKAVKVGSFIRLRNVHDTRIPNGIRRYLMVFSKSYLTPLPNMTYEVVRMLEAHNDRLINNDPMNPSSGVLPLGRARGDNIRRSNSNNSSTASVSLASLTTQPISTLFSGKVRIVGLFPSLGELASSDAGGGLCQICGAGRNFAVQLSDHDDRRPPLDVILSGNSVAAANILGMSPNEAIKAQNNEQVMSRLGRITSNMNDNSSPCWWNAKVRSVALEGAKYFVLESIESL